MLTRDPPPGERRVQPPRTRWFPSGATTRWARCSPPDTADEAHQHGESRHVPRRAVPWLGAACIPRMTTQLARVTQYFTKTKLDYELFWTGDRDLALHHGYYDATARTHSAALIRMNEVLAGY